MIHITCSLRRGAIQERLRCTDLAFFFALRDSISQCVKPSQEKTPIYRISHLKMYSESNKIPGIPEVGISLDSH